jgi:Zinc finger, ZZ type
MQHPDVVCNGCLGPVIGIRFKCAVRRDFNLCERCKATKPQSYPMTQINNPGDDNAKGVPAAAPSRAPVAAPIRAPVAAPICAPVAEPSHESRCDECSMYPIIGPLYTCTGRNNYDLCSSCEKKKIQPFPMWKTYAPVKMKPQLPVRPTNQQPQAIYQQTQPTYRQTQPIYQQTQPVSIGQVFMDTYLPKTASRQTASASGQQRRAQNSEMKKLGKAMGNMLASKAEDSDDEEVVHHHHYYHTETHHVVHEEAEDEDEPVYEEVYFEETCYEE